MSITMTDSLANDYQTTEAPHCQVEVPFLPEYEKNKVTIQVLRSVDHQLRPVPLKEAIRVRSPIPLIRVRTSQAIEEDTRVVVSVARDQGVLERCYLLHVAEGRLVAVPIDTRSGSQIPAKASTSNGADAPGGGAALDSLERHFAEWRDHMAQVQAHRHRLASFGSVVEQSMRALADARAKLEADQLALARLEKELEGFTATSLQPPSAAPAAAAGLEAAEVFSAAPEAQALPAPMLWQDSSGLTMQLMQAVGPGDGYGLQP